MSTKETPVKRTLLPAHGILPSPLPVINQNLLKELPFYRVMLQKEPELDTRVYDLRKSYFLKAFLKLDFMNNKNGYYF